MKEKKLILDACCGGRMMWFNKKHPRTLYIDKYPRPKGSIEGYNFNCTPDRLMDFRDLKFPSNNFKLVVFDPPHIRSLKNNSWMAKKYGVLDKENWQEDLKKGFDECWRVLKKNGILIFKWSLAETRKKDSITVKEILLIFNKIPLFGHPTGRNGQTMWMCFMKL